MDFICVLKTFQLVQEYYILKLLCYVYTYMQLRILKQQIDGSVLRLRREALSYVFARNKVRCKFACNKPIFIKII